MRLNFSFHFRKNVFARGFKKEIFKKHFYGPVISKKGNDRVFILAKIIMTEITVEQF